MAHGRSAGPDRIPHAAEVAAIVSEARRVIRDAQSEVMPFGAGYQACAEATMALDVLSQFLVRMGEGSADGVGCDAVGRVDHEARCFAAR